MFCFFFRCGFLQRGKILFRIVTYLLRRVTFGSVHMKFRIRNNGFLNSRMFTCNLKTLQIRRTKRMRRKRPETRKWSGRILFLTKTFLDYFSLILCRICRIRYLADRIYLFESPSLNFPLQLFKNSMLSGSIITIRIRPDPDPQPNGKVCLSVAITIHLFIPHFLSLSIYWHPVLP